MDQQTIVIVVIAALVIFLIWTYLRRKSSGSPKVDAVEGVLKDVSDNIKIMEEKLANPQSTKKFQTGNWKRFKKKIGFLETPELASIDQAFTLAGDYNAQTLHDTPVEKLREPLSQSRKALSDWLRANRSKELESQTGIFGGLFKS
jgi:regulatory protein YycI of two-component signal transduction system YycFG